MLSDCFIMGSLSGRKIEGTQATAGLIKKYPIDSRPGWGTLELKVIFKLG